VGVPPSELRPAPTSAIADWVVAAGEGTWCNVDAVVPAVFEAYARILVPLLDDEDHVVRWSDWPVQPVPEDVMWDCGGDPRPVLPALLRLLQPATTSPAECVFGLWTGATGGAMEVPPSPILHWPRMYRDYHLFLGPLELTLAIGSHSTRDFPEAYGTGPDVVWPRDRAWFLATDLDAPLCAVGGSESLIAAILGSPDLEAERTEPNEHIWPMTSP
jgi:hypothetical protein